MALVQLLSMEAGQRLHGTKTEVVGVSLTRTHQGGVPWTSRETGFRKEKAMAA